MTFASPRFLWIAALIVALGALGFDTANRIHRVQMVTNLGGTLVQSPETDANSPTGYASGRRQIIPPLYAIDGYHWVMQTQQMFANGEWRIRNVSYDNAPDGREVHWASPYRWWLGFLAWVDHQATGLPLGQAVERAALYASPLLLGLAMVVLTPLVVRRFSPGAALVLAIVLVGSTPFYDYFVAGYADHHGLAALCGMLCVLSLLAGGSGWVRSEDVGFSANGAALPPEASIARRWFVISAGAGGFGLWVSAATMVPVLVGIGAGVLAAARFKRDTSADKLVRADPSLWKLWGRCGAVTSLAAYLIEYFPFHLGWRLEVNHPLYALAWWGAGELLGQWASAGGNLRTFLKDAVSSAVSLGAFAALVALPLVIFFTQRKTFWVADSFLWALHHEYIAEFQGAGRKLSEAPLTFIVGTWLLPLLAGSFAIGLARQHSTSRYQRSSLIIALAPAVLMLLLAGRQIRWWGVSHSLWIMVLIYVIWSWLLDARLRRARWLGMAAGAVLVVSLMPGVFRIRDAWTERSKFSRTEIQQLAIRDIAQWLRLRMGDERVLVASSPTLTTPLIFHGGLQGTGSLYWENLAGLKETAELFAARSPAEAYAIIRAREITHLVLVSWNDFIEGYTRLVRGLPREAPPPDDAFVLNLMRTKILPPWLRLVPCPLPKNPAFEGEAVFVFEVVPPQNPQESLVSITGYMIDMGQIQTAARLKPALERYSDFLPAQIAVGRLHWNQEQMESLRSLLRKTALLAAQAHTLSLEDHVHFGILLAVAGEQARARQELTACWAKAASNESALRKLPSDTLVYLLAASQQTHVEPPSRKLLALAEHLLPPERLRQLTGAAGR